MNYKLTVRMPYIGLFIMAIIAIIAFHGCNTEDEPSAKSSIQIEEELQNLITTLPMDWGSSINQTKDAMEALHLSNFHIASSISSSVIYENDENSLSIVYGFEKGKLYSVLVVFPKNDNLDYDNLLKKYLYLGCVSEKVYADDYNNRLISIHTCYTNDESNYTWWSAIGFTMIDDEAI